MTQKTISLPEELYNKLKAKKRNNENFPELIARLLYEDENREKLSISTFFGKLDEDSPEEWDNIEKNILQARLAPNTRKQLHFEE